MGSTSSSQHPYLPEEGSVGCDDRGDKLFGDETVGDDHRSGVDGI